MNYQKGRLILLKVRPLEDKDYELIKQAEEVM